MSIKKSAFYWFGWFVVSWCSLLQGLQVTVSTKLPPSRQNLSLCYCAVDLGGFRLGDAQIRDQSSLLLSFVAQFFSPVVCVPGSTLLKSALAGPEAGFSGLFSKLADAYGVGS